MARSGEALGLVKTNEEFDPRAKGTERAARSRGCPLLLEALESGATAWTRELMLPPRLVRVALCLALGDSDREAAQRLTLGLRTLRSYCQDLFRRLEVTSRVQAANRVLAAVGCDGDTRACKWDWEASLPPRLLRVATCAAEGLSDKEISEQLALSPHTVRNYLKETYARLGVRGRLDLICTVVPRS